MSGIYIPDMEVPKNCKDCTRMGISHCPMKEEPIIVNGYDKPLNCPLVEVPSHGVLKDIDVLNDAIIEAVRLGEITGGEAGFFKAILTNAPIVIDTSKH